MSRAAAKLEAIRKKLPRGMRLPRRFARFVALVTSDQGPRHDALRIGWCDARRLLNVDKSALSDFIPFVQVGDGGVVALWKDEDELRVVHHDSEGQHSVLALSFEDFLARLAKPSAFLRERLALDRDIDIGALTASSKPTAVTASVNRRFTRWLAAHSLSAPPSRSPNSDRVRRKLVALARRMLTDGLSKTSKLRDFYWSMQIRLVRKGGTWNATYLDFGNWHALPARYGLHDILSTLLPLMKTPRKARFELTIVKDGNVYVDGGNELTLE